MSKATSNAHDWHCEEHDTYGWRGEACRRCQEAPSESTTLRGQVEKLKAELKSIDGALNDPRANLTLTTSEIIWELKEQVSKLTKERDDLRSRRCEVCGYLEHEREHTGCLREQLAALAEQNEKQRAFLEFAWKGIPMSEYAFEILEHVMNLPNLASPVLNRIRAEAMEEAAKIANEHEGVAWAVSAIRNRKAELEKSNG